MSKNSKRQELIAEYIKKHQRVSRDDILKQFKISSATLTGDIKAIRAQGIKLISPHRSGFVYIEKSTAKKESTYNRFDKYIIRKWIVLYCIDSAPDGISFDSLYEILTHRFGFNENMLRRDITYLHQHGHIDIKKADKYGQTKYLYFSTRKNYAILEKSSDQLLDFIDKYVATGRSSTHNKNIETVYKKASILSDIPLPEKNYFFFRGKNAELEQSTQDILDTINIYRAHLISFNYHRPDKTSVSFKHFHVGLIFYSDENNRFYILGEHDGNKLCIRLDRIDIATLSKEKRYNFSTDKDYLQIFNEMFSTAYEEQVYDVKVRFYAALNTQKKLEALLSSRKDTASITKESDDYLIYTDHIRGLSSFASYIRSYGYAAQVLEPDILANNIQESARKVMENYESYGLL